MRHLEHREHRRSPIPEVPEVEAPRFQARVLIHLEVMRDLRYEDRGEKLDDVEEYHRPREGAHGGGN